MTFDAFDAMSEAAFLWWVVKVALALGAFCTLALLVRWVWNTLRDRRSRRDEHEIEEFWRECREKRAREEKRRAELQADEALTALLRRVAQGCFGASKEMQLMMVGPSIRILQIPLANKLVRMGGYAGLFNAENIELEHMPSWFMGKFYDLSMGYGPESKLVAWRLEA